MKRFVYFGLLVCMFHATEICANSLVKGREPLKQPVRHHFLSVQEAAPDSSKNRLRKLPFNSGNQEVSPAVSNGYLYFFESNNEFLTQVFRVRLSDIAHFDKSKLEEVIVKPSGKYVYIYLNFTSDGSEALLNVIDRKIGTNNLFIGKAEDLANINKLHSFEYNSKKFSNGRATISPDGKMMVFSSDRPDSYGKVDLWLCKLVSGKWQTPENMGKSINTIGNETMPCFVSNTRLCFASDEHTGFGGFDLFYTDLKGGGFTPPKNMGSEVNSKFNDFGICYSKENESYYFSSDRTGNYDIYSCNPETVSENQPQITAPVLVTTESEANDKPKTVDKQVVPSAKKISSAKKPEIASVSPDTLSGSSVAFDDTVQAPAEETEVIDKRIKTTSVNLRPKKQIEPVVQKSSDEHLYYSIQIAALGGGWFNKGYYRRVLDSRKKYFLVREDGLVKIRVGHFTSYRQATLYVKENGIGEFYIVPMKSTQVIEYLDENSN